MAPSSLLSKWRCVDRGVERNRPLSRCGHGGDIVEVVGNIVEVELQCDVSKRRQFRRAILAHVPIEPSLNDLVPLLTGHTLLCMADPWRHKLRLGTAPVWTWPQRHADLGVMCTIMFVTAETLGISTRLFAVGISVCLTGHRRARGIPAVPQQQRKSRSSSISAFRSHPATSSARIVRVCCCRVPRVVCSILHYRSRYRLA